MHVTIKAIAGPASGEKFVLRHGQVARVGRTEWADFAVEHDEQLDDLHFELQCSTHECRLFTFDGAKPVLINGQQTAVATLRHADRIQAGQSTFLIELAGVPAATYGSCDHSADGTSGGCHPAELASEAQEPHDTTDPTLNSPPPLPATLAEWCQALELSDAEPLLSEITDPQQLIATLAAEEKFPAAITLRAALLPTDKAVRWAGRCVAQSVSNLSPASEEALVAAENWVRQPSEATRRRAEQAAVATEFEGPAAWVALAAFWSSGSIAPADLPPVAPPLGLSAKAVSAALTLAATGQTAQPAQEVYQAFLQMNA